MAGENCAPCHSHSRGVTWDHGAWWVGSSGGGRDMYVFVGVGVGGCLCVVGKEN